MTVFLRRTASRFMAAPTFRLRTAHGMPGFPQILTSIAEAYRDKPRRVERASTIFIAELLQRMSRCRRSEPKSLHQMLIARAAEHNLQAYDAGTAALAARRNFRTSVHRVSAS